MRSRRRFLAVASAIAVAGCSDGEETGEEDTDGGDTDGGDTDGEAETDGEMGADGGTEPDGRDDSLRFSSAAFEDGGTIPEQYTGVGADVSPPLTVESVPDQAESLALIVDDPDANDYVHWLVWNVPADIETVPEGIPQEETVSELDGAVQGTNDFGELGYRGPLPPADDDAHTYRFAMSAVDTTLDLPAGAGRGELEDALEEHVVDTHRITGEFDR